MEVYGTYSAYGEKGKLGVCVCIYLLNIYIHTAAKLHASHARTHSSVPFSPYIFLRPFSPYMSPFLCVRVCMCVS